MGSAIKQFGDSEDWPRLAAYIANLPALKPLRTVRGNHEKGKALYAMCASCHGPMAKATRFWVPLHSTFKKIGISESSS